MSPERQVTIAIEPSATLEDACHRFLADLRGWVYDCMERYAGTPPTDVHDQGTYTTGWEPYLAVCADAAAPAFLMRLRDAIAAHFVATGAWQHGYWVMHEVHHGTEHFELFLGALLRLHPDDATTRAQLIDMAEHIGNWSPDVAPWFDETHFLFYSSYFGVDGVQRRPGSEVNIPDHLRCANICMLAYQASGEERFLHFARRYAQHWAAAIVATPALPIGLTADGPIDTLNADAEATYRGFVGQASTDLSDAVERAENLLASDAVGLLIGLWRATGDAPLRAAAEQLLDLLVTQIADPDAGAVAAAVRVYRRATGSERYDTAARSAIAELAPQTVRTITLDTAWRAETRPRGVGKREDMLRWLEDGQPRRCSPLLLALVAEIDNDRELARVAIDLARAYFAAARAALPDGRDHGCAARSVSAVARGHGRENHAGVTTAVLRPILETFFAGIKWNIA
jgi:hypothetical protein